MHEPILFGYLSEVLCQLTCRAFHFSASDKPELEVFVWYMTKENYREMRLGKTTEVFIPLFEEYYTLHLYGVINLPLEERCTVITPPGDQILIETTDTNLNRLEYPIAASEGTSGVYSVNCSIAYNDEVDGYKHTLVAKKSLNITFIRGRWKVNVITLGNCCTNRT